MIKSLQKQTKHIYQYDDFIICLFPYRPYKKNDKYFYIDSYYFVSNKVYHFFKSFGIELYKGDLKKLVVDAGIGTVGKNSLVYVNELGSFFYIAAFKAEDKHFAIGPLSEENGEIKPKCCNCNKCVHACPQKCIEPNSIKTNCIRALAGTAQVKQLGCNLCQLVCPMNAMIKVKPTPLKNRIKPQNIDYKKLEKMIGRNLARKKYFE